LLNSKNENWVNGPELQNRRDCISCGRIRSDKESSKFSIIVVGGYYGGHLTSTEILDDEQNSEWRTGPGIQIKIIILLT